MNGHLRISSHVIKASSMKGSNPSEETGKGNSEESEAMQGAEEGFKGSVAKRSEIRERPSLQEKEQDGIHSGNEKELLAINHLSQIVQ